MKDLTTGKEGKLIFQFAIPMLLGTIFQQMYSFVDRIIVGKSIGHEALTAIGNSGPIIFALISLVVGIATGGTIVISQFYGAKDFGKLRSAVDTLFIFLFVASIIVTIIGLSFKETILGWVDVPKESIPAAAAYLSVYLSGLIVFFGYNGVAAVLRGLGDSKTPLYFLILASMLNIIFDVLFVMILHWGVQGAAYASILAQGIAFLSSVIYLNKTHSVISFRLKGLKFDMAVFKQSIRISLPSGFQTTAVAVGMIALYKIVNQFQEPVPAAYSAAGSIDMMAVMPAMVFSQALSSFVGQNIGANKIERVKRGLLATLGFSTLVNLMITFSIIIGAEWMLNLFIPENNPVGQQFISVGKEYLLIVSSFYIILNTMFIFNAVLRGAGDTIVPMFVTIIALWFVRIPVAIVLSDKMGELGIWWAVPSGWIFGMCFSIIYYLSGRWKRKGVVQHAEVEV